MTGGTVAVWPIQTTVAIGDDETDSRRRDTELPQTTTSHDETGKGVDKRSAAAPVTDRDLSNALSRSSADLSVFTFGPSLLRVVCRRPQRACSGVSMACGPVPPLC